MSGVLSWLAHSIVTIFSTWGLTRLLSQLGIFPNSHLAHCAVSYVLSKNATNSFEAFRNYRKYRYEWEDRKKRVVLTTITVINEVLVLYLLASNLPDGYFFRSE